MCLIVAMPANNRLSIDDLNYARKSNPDGFGICWHNPQQNKVEIFKSVTSSLLMLEYGLSLIPNDVAAIIHFRFATRGTVTSDNQHPFVVLGDESNATLAMVHNGTIKGIGDNIHSDSYCLAKELRNVLSGNPELLANKYFQDMLFARIGANDKGIYPNRLAFLSNTGEITLINEESGIWRNGCWLSNADSLFSKTYDAYNAKHPMLFDNEEGAQSSSLGDTGYRRNKTSEIIIAASKAWRESSLAWDSFEESKKESNRIHEETESEYEETESEYSIGDLLDMTEDELLDFVIANPCETRELILQLLYDAS